MKTAPAGAVFHGGAGPGHALPDVTDLEDELLRYEKAASELKVAYEAAVKMASNLPAYDKLVK